MAAVRSSSTTLRRPGAKRGEQPHPVLRVVHSPDLAMLGAEFLLDGSTHTFGRNQELKSAVADERMSRQHFRVQPGTGGYLIEDLESTNGTYLDGRAVRGRLPLDGQVIAAGDTLMVVDPVPDLDRLPSTPGADGDLVRGLIGVSGVTRALRASVATVAPTPGGVLLLGPTGVGKEVSARAIHDASGRRGPFVPINCAAIPAELAEAELFGHDKGAFTGADRARIGAFRQSSGGTLFLDEVGDLPRPVQAKLLRVLEDAVVQPLGGGEVEQVDLRVVAATHKDLTAGGFRKDLLARLCDWVLHLPPLAQRKADILHLWRHFLVLEGHRAEHQDAELYEALLLHDWPMNVRELRKLARRLVVLTGGGEIDVALLPAEMKRRLEDRDDDRDRSEPRPRASTSRGRSDEIDETDPPSREQLEAALAAARGNVKLAAENNGWHRTQLYRWLKLHRVDPARFR